MLVVLTCTLQTFFMSWTYVPALALGRMSPPATITFDDK